MIISGSILSIKDNMNKIIELSNSGIDLLHLDVMDGKFVDNVSLNYLECKKIKELTNIPLDVHLMVLNPKEYIKEFITLEPKYITFHIETDNLLENINYVKQHNILVGLAINPETEIERIFPYIDMIDLVLIMTVNPGYGGQKLIDDCLKKIDVIKDKVTVSVDGGVNLENIKSIKSDIVVIGSTITNSSNYKEQVKKIGDLI